MSETPVRHSNLRQGFERFKNLDLLSPPTVDLTYNGQTKFQTYIGAFFTTMICLIISTMFIYCILLFDYSSQDIIFTSNEIYPHFSPSEGINITKNNENPAFDFMVYVNDASFDNDDNPYG